MRIAGASTTARAERRAAAPRARWPAPARASPRRVRPASGPRARASASSSCSAATGPTTRDRRRADVRSRGALGDRRRACASTCAGRAASRARRPRPARPAARPPATSCSAIRGSCAHAHVEDERPGEARRAPASRSAVSGLAGSSWPVTNATALAIAALGDRDPGVGRRRDAGGDARARPRTAMPGRAQRLRLLAAAPEDERVAALEPHDRRARRARARRAAASSRPGAPARRRRPCRRRRPRRPARASASASGGIRRSWRMTSALAISSQRARGQQAGVARARRRRGTTRHGASDLARAAPRQQPRGDLGAERARARRRRARRAPRRCRRRGRRRRAACSPPSRRRTRVRADRRVAVGLERAHERALGGSSARVAGASSMRRDARRSLAGARRHGQARPGPAAGTSSSSGAPRVAAAQALRARRRPARSRRSSPSASLRRRVSTLPRSSTTSRSARSARSCAARRSDERADARARRPARRATRAPHSASRGSARGGDGGDARCPSGSSRGHVLGRVHGEVDRRRRAARASSSRTQRSLSDAALGRGRRWSRSRRARLAAEQRRHLARLRQRQRAAARPDPHARRLSGRTLSAAAPRAPPRPAAPALGRRLVEPEQLAQQLLAAVAALLGLQADRRLVQQPLHDRARHRLDAREVARRRASPSGPAFSARTWSTISAPCSRSAAMVGMTSSWRQPAREALDLLLDDRLGARALGLADARGCARRRACRSSMS